MHRKAPPPIHAIFHEDYGLLYLSDHAKLTDKYSKIWLISATAETAAKLSFIFFVEAALSVRTAWQLQYHFWVKYTETILLTLTDLRGREFFEN